MEIGSILNLDESIFVADLSEIIDDTIKEDNIEMKELVVFEHSIEGELVGDASNIVWDPEVAADEIVNM